MTPKRNIEFIAAIALLVEMANEEEESISEKGKEYLISIREDSTLLLSALDSLTSVEHNLEREKWAISTMKRYLKAYEKEQTSEC